MFVLKRIIDIIIALFSKIRHIIESVLGFGRPLEALFLGGTFVLLILAIADVYITNILLENQATSQFFALVVALLLINTIYAYGLTFFFVPSRSPGELAYRIVWNFVYVLNILLASTYLDLVWAEYQFGSELILLTALFLVVLGIASWLKPAQLSSKDLAEGLKTLRENISQASQTLQEGNRIVRESLRSYRLELESLLRLFRVSHVALLSILFSFVSVAIYAVVDYANQIGLSQIDLGQLGELSFIIAWIIMVIIVIVILVAGLKRSDFLNTTGEMEQGLLDAELEL
ncbi:MAG: hypothetical protein ACFFDI_28370 [Promethearchaeota archaeon]